MKSSVDSIFTKKGPFCLDIYESGDSGRNYFNESKVLVIGAGGLGCELLKSLALSGFKNIEVIDMDTIDVSNLNRQFLFRSTDVGRPKSVAAAEFIKKRVPSCNIKAHFCKIQDLPDEFYMNFQVVIAGLDSIKARNWISEKLCEIARNNDLIIPYIDGGTEEWKGHVKFILPTQTACMQCQEELFPPQVHYQLCTIATSPRQPEHCIAWAKDIAWVHEKPNESIDGDNDEHIQWILNKAETHAVKFGITGLTFSMARGVVKNIIPAIASTQAIIASICTTEALKLITGCGSNINNNVLISSNTGIYCSNFLFDKKSNCSICSRQYTKIKKIENETVQEFRIRLGNEFGYIEPSLSTFDTKIYWKMFQNTYSNLNLPINQFVPNSDYVIVVTSIEKKDPLELIIVDEL